LIAQVAIETCIISSFAKVLLVRSDLEKDNGKATQAQQTQFINVFVALIIGHFAIYDAG
jgi:hypothetical protein